MRIPRVFTKNNLRPHADVDLEPEPSHHLLRVLRMSVGRSLIVFNGDGHEYSADIIEIDKKRVTVRTGEKTYKPRTSTLTSEIAIGMSKGDRLDWIIQKTTELGVTKICPLYTTRCEIKLDAARLEKKMQSWAQTAVSACEQSQRNVLPAIQPPTPLNEYIEKCATEAKFILHHRASASLGEPPPASVSFLIGPEGGLTDEEIQHAERHGFLALRLGNRVMRTETAPMAALSIAQFLWGDLGSLG